MLQTDGSVKRVQRAETLGSVKAITRQIARSVLNQKLKTETHNQRWPQAVRPFSEFVDTEWRPNAALAVKKSTMKFYNFQLERHIVPVFGSCSLSEVNRNQIESLLSKLREKGHASGTLRGVRTTISTVLQSAVERGYLDGNAAHGIRIRSMGVKPKPRFYSPTQVQKLLPELSLPCRTVVQVAVLTGMRIGEILGLRWKRVDFLRKTLEVAETFSDGEFGTPKTNSSNRVLPISSSLCEVLETHRSAQKLCGPDDLAFHDTSWKLHSVRRISTTVNSHQLVIELRSHAFRGMLFGTRMRHCSRMWESPSRLRRRNSAIQILRRL